jgi:hypothetical protein
LAREGQGWLHGPVDERGRFSGKDVMFIYPDLTTCLLGEFHDETMVMAFATKVIDATLNNEVKPESFFITFFTRVLIFINFYREFWCFKRYLLSLTRYPILTRHQIASASSAIGTCRIPMSRLQYSVNHPQSTVLVLQGSFTFIVKK